MPPGDLYIAAGFLGDHRNEVTAVGTVLAAIALATLVDRALARRALRLATVVRGGELSAVADTRLRLLRRLVFVGILVIGVALGLMQFAAVKRAAAGILASSAVLGLVVGFAARQTLANIVAGVLLAITQPIRIGDMVSFEGETGVVEDVRLTYTYLNGEDGRRIIIPNERLASSTIENFTIVDPRIEVEVTIGLPPDADPGRALEALADLGEVEVSAIEKDGYQLVVRSRADHPLERRALGARIRAACLERLRRENILG
ncbi:MAG: mechanosensitive ion channel family protein [Thermoleophilaceae bacterium]